MGSNCVDLQTSFDTVSFGPGLQVYRNGSDEKQLQVCLPFECTIVDIVKGALIVTCKKDECTVVNLVMGTLVVTSIEKLLVQRPNTASSNKISRLVIRPLPSR